MFGGFLCAVNTVLVALQYSNEMQQTELMRRTAATAAAQAAMQHRHVSGARTTAVIQVKVACLSTDSCAKECILRQGAIGLDGMLALHGRCML
jgi:hypothetical protein